MSFLFSWTRTADFGKDTKSVMRPHVGPIAYARFLDNDTHKLQLNVSPTYFYGFDLNSPVEKGWRSHEVGNFTNLAYTFKPKNVSLDVHNWYVKGLSIKLADKLSADESGFIMGSTLAWQPFAAKKDSFFKSLEFYLRFREWGWLVEPEGIPASRKWWAEWTTGFKQSADFSVFE